MRSNAQLPVLLHPKQHAENLEHTLWPLQNAVGMLDEASTGCVV